MNTPTHYDLNREKKIQQVRDYRNNPLNKEKIKERARLYYIKNKEKIKERKKNYYNEGYYKNKLIQQFNVQKDEIELGYDSEELLNNFKETLEEFIKLIARYVIKPPMGGKDYGAKIKTLKLINQCINLNVENTKKSDLFMAFGYTLMAMNAYLDIRVQGNKNDYEEALPQLLAMLGRRSL